MSEQIIPIFPHVQIPSSASPWKSSQPVPESVPLLDALQRPCHDLRISVTDRCNFRCVYCMPREIFNPDYSYLPQTATLSFEEITRTVKLFTQLGIKKIRLTGGEPLLRKSLHELVAKLSQIPTLDENPQELTLTTNGVLLPQKARQLKEAGLNRITVSLDSLDETIFKRISDTNFSVSDVLRGIDAAQEAGFHSIKINMVVKAGLNENQIVPMARYFKNSPHTLRFIEFMDVGSSNGWRRNDVISAQTIINQIHNASDDLRLIPVKSNVISETAQRWQYQDGGGEIGVIASVTQPFCQNCTRLRLSADGQLFTCLFSGQGHNLRELLRGEKSDQYLVDHLAQLWKNRNDRYSELRVRQIRPQKIEMSYIGG